MGQNSDTVSNSYASSNVTGSDYVGGLAGMNEDTMSNSYASSNVTGSDYVGGLVGANEGTVNDSYSTGSVTGVGSVGGLVGENGGDTVSDSFWDTETSGQPTSPAGIGKTTEEMQDIITFTDTDTVGLDEPWDITTVANSSTRDTDYIWNIVNDETYPFLSWQPV